MRKHLIIGALLILMIALGFLYRMIMLPPSEPPVDYGPVTSETIRIPLHTWSFEPEHIDMKLGTRIQLTVTNEDDQEHGFSIDQFQISLRIPAGGSVELPIITPKQEGDILYYCSENCGGGVAESGPHRGETRGRFDMQGILRVDAHGTHARPSEERSPH